MIDAIIHIENENEIWDKEVFVECKLPAVPEIGSIIHLDRELEALLELKAFNATTKQDYFPRWFYGNHPKRFEDLTDENKLSFSDAIIVKYVKYEPNNKKVRITLGD